MIIRFPTALYESILPQKPDDGGNVTYTVSMQDPPRAFQTTTRLPPAVEHRDKPDKVLDDDTRRIHLGKRIFTISRTRKTQVGSGKKQFEVGQILTFGDTQASGVDPMLVDNLELRHDTNLLDLESLGLTEEDISAVESSAMSTLLALQTELSGYISTRKDVEIRINENQKLQNETRKALASVEQLAAIDSSFNEMVEDLSAKIPVLEAEMEELIGQANVAATSAAATRDKIIDLVQVVR